jgi:predicted ATPase
LPTPAAQLVGRSEAIAMIRSLFSQHRMITIVGPGGIGKTALAIEVAQGMRGTMRSQIYFVDLAAVLDPVFVAAAAASSMGISVGLESVSPERIAAQVGTERLLIVLDNCEHVVVAAATLADSLLRSCRNVSILATSREPLRIVGERAFRLGPLDVPGPLVNDPREIYATPAVRLFISRMSQGDGSPAEPEPDLIAIATICRRLDGIPLAIEFAAGRARSIGVGPTAANLDDRFGILTNDGAAPLTRHRTLLATLDWSYDLLTDAERRWLRHLGVFAGGFTVEAAAAVVGEGLSPIDSLESIARLVTKSLLAQDQIPGRWRLLETIRVYALDKLKQCGEYDQAARRQAAFLRDLFFSSAANTLAADKAKLFVPELDNVRAALDWCFSPGGDAPIGVALTAGYAPAWIYLSLGAECRERCEAAMERWSRDYDPDERLLLMLLIRSASQGGRAETVEKTRSRATRSIEIARSLGDGVWEARSLRMLWVCEHFSGNIRNAIPMAEQLIEIVQRSRDEVQIAEAERSLGYSLFMAGEPRPALTLFERSMGRTKGIDPERYNAVNAGPYRWQYFNEHAVSRSLFALALWFQGRLDRAITEVRDAFMEVAEEPLGASMCNVLRGAMCRIEIMTGRLEEAAASIALLRDTASKFGYNTFFKTGDLLNAALLIKRGHRQEGIRSLHHAIAEVMETGWTAWLPEFHGILADGLLGLGRVGEAMHSIEEGIRRSEASGEYWYLPELLRLKGEIAIADGRPSDAARQLGDAAVLAAQQEALTWELRIAMSRVKQKQAEGSSDTGRDTLASVYERFTEGLGTPDLQLARELLHVA